MIIVSASKKELVFNGKTYPCAIGKGFCSADEKKEGDGMTPLGTYPLRELLYRADKFENVPVTTLPVQTIHKNHGWCDGSTDKNYNKLVSLPYDASHEELWRSKDELYDLIVPLGYNDNPPIAGKGSAIFFHIAREKYTPTEGCVAVSKEDMLEILFHCTPNTQMHIIK